MNWTEFYLDGSRVYGNHVSMERARVARGWLVRATTYNGDTLEKKPISCSVTYVPDEEGTWRPS